MRTIKFRGKSISPSSKGQWFFGYPTWYKHYDRFGNVRGITQGIHFLDGRITKEVEIDPETVSQFTGLTDKNGKEIYEGDIVECKEFNNQAYGDLTCEDRQLFSIDELKGELKEQYVSEVFYEEANFFVNQDGKCEVPLACFFGNMKNSSPIFEIEIVGNIHEKGGEK